MFTQKTERVLTTTEIMSACGRLREAKSFSVVVVWFSTVVCYILFGAITPLLPLYVKEFAGIKTKVNVLSNYSTNSVNASSNIISETNGKASVIIGALLGISKLAQLVTTPVVGVTIDKIGYDIPLFIGYTLQIVVSLGFAFVDEEVFLFVLQIIHGISAAFIIIASSTVVADLYRDDDLTRGKMISYAFCGPSVGVMIGPPLGSALYQFGSKLAPFITIAVMTFCVALARLWVRIPRVNPIQGGVRQASPLKTQLILLTDPYVFCCLLLTVIGLLGIAFLEAILANHMLQTMHPEKWMLGVVYLPLNIGFSIGTPVQNWLTRKVGRWVVAFYSFLLSAGPYIAYPFCRNFTELLLPGFPLGFLISARPAAVVPALSYLLHTRYGPWAYGAGYALADMAISFAFTAGPFLAGFLVTVIGFEGVMYLSAALSISTLVPLAFLRKSLSGEESSEETPIIIGPSEEEADTSESREEDKR